MLRRIMESMYETLRSVLPHIDRFDRLLGIGWEETGGMILAAGAIAFMSLIGIVRTR